MTLRELLTEEDNKTILIRLGHIINNTKYEPLNLKWCDNISCKSEYNREDVFAFREGTRFMRYNNSSVALSIEQILGISEVLKEINYDITSKAN